MIVCSREYLKSDYCRAELDYFLSLHGGETDRVLAVLAKGEPQDIIPRALTAPPADPADPFPRTEPLGADVRGETLREQLKKLRREFLRIAAPLMGCGFDDLFRRHLRRRRRRILFISLAVLLAACIAGAYGTYKDRQVQAQTYKKNAQLAETVETRVQALLSRGNGAQADEQAALLLASAYIRKPELTGQPALSRALASAAAQAAIRENANAFPRVLYTEYPYETQGLTLGVFYYIAPADAILFMDGKNATRAVVVDAKTGAVLRDLGESKITVTGDNHYLFRYSDSYRADADTLTRTVSLIDLYEDRELVSEPLAEVTETTDVSTYVCGNDGPFAVFDGKTFLAAYDAQGNRIGEDAFNAVFYAGKPASAPSVAPYTLTKKRGVYEISNQAGETVRTLPQGVVQFAFSDDYGRFAYALDQTVTMLSTAGWTETGRVSWENAEILLKADILSANPNLICLMFRKADAAAGSDANYVRVYDVSSGACLLNDEPGTPPQNQTGERYYVCSQGLLSAYVYHPACAGETAQIQTVFPGGQTALAKTDAETRLIDVQTGAVPARWNAKLPLAYSDDGSRFLSAEGGSLRLYDAAGAPLWTEQTDAEVIALSSGGKAAASASGTEVTLWNGEGKEAASYTLPFAPEYLAVSDGLIYAGTDGEGALLRGGTQTALSGKLPFGEGRLTDGLLIVHDRWQKNLNFVVCSEDGTLLYRPENSVEAYQYAAQTHLLAVQERSLDGYPYPSLTIYRNNDGKLTELCTVDTDHQRDRFSFDESGAYLTVTGEEETAVYRLEPFAELLRIHGAQGLYEGGRIYALTCGETGVFSQALDADTLLRYAKQRLTSAHGERTLTVSEDVFAAPQPTNGTN